MNRRSDSSLTLPKPQAIAPTFVGPFLFWAFCWVPYYSSSVRHEVRVRLTVRGISRLILTGLTVLSGLMAACQAPRMTEPTSATTYLPEPAGRQTEHAPPQTTIQAKHTEDQGSTIAPEAVAPPLATTTFGPVESRSLAGDLLIKPSQVDPPATAQVNFDGPPTYHDPNHAPASGQMQTRPLALALEAFLANRPDDAIRHLQTYTARDQELVMRLLPLLSAVDQEGLFTAHPKPDQVQRSVEALRQIESDLRPLAPLLLERLTFCHEVKRYGRFTPVEAARFQPGDSRYLYAELRNLVDRRAPDGAYAVRLKGMVEFFGADGKPVGPMGPMPAGAYPSASQRQDFFVSITFRVPLNLAPGQYTVRVRVDDLDTGRVAEASLPFQVVSKRPN